MKIEAHERDRLHVFAVNRPADEIRKSHPVDPDEAHRAVPNPALLADLTGFDALDLRGVELIDLKHLEGLGLSGFLEEGHDIAEEALAPVRARLEALDGFVLILRSQALQGAALDLSGSADLTHICSFHQPGTDWRSSGPVAAEAAKPFSGTKTPPRVARHRAQRVGGIIVAVFLIVIGLILWAVLT